MRNEKWEMTVASPTLRLGHRSMPHIISRFGRRGSGETCGATYYKSVRCVSSGTLPLFVALSGLQPGVTHKSVLSGDGIQFPYPHPTQSALRPPFSACSLREMRVWKIFFAGVGSFANFAIWRGNIRDGVGLSLCP